MDDAATARIEAWLRATLPADEVVLTDWRKLSGGAIQQNWAVTATIDGTARHWVLRTDSPATLAVSRSRADEFFLLRAAENAGVAVPHPVLLCNEPAVLARPFFLMDRICGEARAHRVVRSDTLGGGRESLAAGLGRELARIHSIVPPRTDLGFLGPPPAAPAAAAIAACHAALDADATPRPILEWGLRHLARTIPPQGDIVLCHNDFRTGNVMLTEAGIAGVLDWEFAGWGDPHADIGWLCAPCWRFGNKAMPVGGIGPFAPFAAAYSAASGRTIRPEAVAWWSLLAAIRWAVIAIAQAARHLSGAEPSLELALTAHIVPELECDIMALTAEHTDA
jgi:aminoglycoside phosphotransferase (APT) family kinase protein